MSTNFNVQEQVLQHKAVLSLILYRNARKQKKHLNDIAQAHYAHKVYVQVFPMWLTQVCLNVIRKEF